jgi:putative membrane-bound dehydrogenase-like protein
MARTAVLAFLIACVGGIVAANGQEMPKVLDDRLQLDLIAESPQLMTPTGVAIEKSGRVLVIESHTHFPPKDYDGPKHDRILAFDPKTPSSPVVFYEGSTHTMNLGVHPDGSVYVATRQRVFRLRDSDSDGRADQETEIAHLETTGNYPHNGLSGFAFGYEGDVYFGFGENLGADYKLVASDGTTLSGGGEGGNVYHCRADGSKLRRMATGFWNPFAMYLDPLDRLFVVDNDPDSRPPCRLLHIVEQGDYGYRFRNGRKGVHPFTAWNGELPGTLPMVAGTGEAPSGIVGADSDQWPDDLRGALMVTSWGDHRIECYPLKPRGLSFSAERKVLVAGGENFRPAGMAIAPDGSIWFSDWVDKSYELHKKGRLWRLSVKGKCGPEIAERVQRFSTTAREGVVWAIGSSDRLYRETALRAIEREASEDNIPWLELNEVVTKSADLNCRVAAMRTHFRMHWMRAPAGAKVRPLQFLPAVLEPGAEAELKAQTTLWWLTSNAFKQQRNELPEGALGDVMKRNLSAIATEVYDAQRFAQHPDLHEAYLALLMIPNYSEVFKEKRLPANVARTFYPDQRIENALEINDPFLFHRCVEQLRSQIRANIDFPRKTANRRLAYAVAAVREALEQAPPELEQWLADPDMNLRMVALNYVHDKRLAKFSDQVRDSLKTATNRQVFEASLATLQVLSDKPYDPSKESRGEEEVAKLATDSANPPEVRSMALRMLRADHPALKVSDLESMLSGTDRGLAIEAIRKLGERTEPEAQARLKQLVMYLYNPLPLRAEGVAVLSPDEKGANSLLRLGAKTTREEEMLISETAMRQLRGKVDTAQADDIAKAWGDKAKLRDPESLALLATAKPSADRPKPEEVDKWLATLVSLGSQKGDSERGRAVFFSRQARCSSCHESEGRGASVGPNLTGIGKTMTRARLLASILRPSAEVAPQFAPLRVTTNDGLSRTGLYVGEEVDGTVNYIDDKGKKFQVHPRDLESREEVKTSIMPEQLTDGLTLIEIKDLLAYLGDGNDGEAK